MSFDLRLLVRFRVFCLCLLFRAAEHLSFFLCISPFFQSKEFRCDSKVIVKMVLANKGEMANQGRVIAGEMKHRQGEDDT